MVYSVPAETSSMKEHYLVHSSMKEHYLGHSLMKEHYLVHSSMKEQYLVHSSMKEHYLIHSSAVDHNGVLDRHMLTKVQISVIGYMVMTRSHWVGIGGELEHGLAYYQKALVKSFSVVAA